jgi:hypothetical protein
MAVYRLADLLPIQERDADDVDVIPPTSCRILRLSSSMWNGFCFIFCPLIAEDNNDNG